MTKRFALGLVPLTVAALAAGCGGSGGSSGSTTPTVPSYPASETMSVSAFPATMTVEAGGVVSTLAFAKPLSGGGTITVSASVNPPPEIVARLNMLRRPMAAHVLTTSDGYTTGSGIVYVKETMTDTISFAKMTQYTFVFPVAHAVSGELYTLAELTQVTPTLEGLPMFAATPSVNRSIVGFPAEELFFDPSTATSNVPVPFTLEAGNTYYFACVPVGTALATPEPSTSPTITPTTSPTAAPTYTPPTIAPSPTATPYQVR